MARLDEIEAFVAVVDAGGFSAAAPKLGLTPSAVSKLIGRLESRLGVRLLQRTTRRLRATPDGEAYFRRATRILEDLRDADAELGQGNSQPRGLLRVTTSVGLGQTQIAPLMAEFLLRYPDIRLELSVDDRTADLVSEGFDLAIRLGRMDDSSLIVRQLGTIRRRIFAAPSYLERRGVPRTPADLAHHNCLNFTTTSWLNSWALREGEAGAVREFPVAGNFLGNNGELMYQMALAGVGILRLAEFMAARDIRDGRLTALLDDCNPNEAIPLYAAWPPGRFLALRLRVLIDYLVEKFTPKPPWAT